MEYDLIKPYIEKGLISEQRHPDHRQYAIFNYTQKCQFSRAWDDVTRQCRGLILDLANEKVVARPFPKFFNYQEHVQNAWPIPGDTPMVMDKLDGSLGILYYLQGKPWIATRGSFTSDQAMWATNWWRENVKDTGEWWKDNYTHLFEIIYPENRVVVNYDFSGLVHLTTIDNETGRPVNVEWRSPIRTVRQIPINDVEELMKLDEPNSEGFVIYYPKENVRMKIKFPEYVRLHRIVTGVSEIAIWERLRDGKSLEDLIDKVPDEFYQWVAQTSNRLNDAFNAIRDQAERDYNSINELMNSELVGGGTRKEWAEQIKNKKNPGLLFSLLDDKPLSPAIWRMIRPHGQQSFKIDIDS